jgi:hypothetical protein
MITKEAWDIMLNTKPPHKGFDFQPIDYGNYIGIRVFLDNFAEFNRQQQEDLAWWIGMEIINKIRHLGIDCYLEGYETRGGSKL